MADLDEVLTERGARYGKFVDHAEVTQWLKHVIRAYTMEKHLAKPGVDGPLVRTSFFTPDQQEALDMICHKIGRVVAGDPNYADSWVDIAGYAKLVADRLMGEER